MSNITARGFVHVAILAIGLGAGAFGLSQAQQPPQQQATDPAVATAESVATSFRHVAGKTLPGVVSVISRTRAVEVPQQELNPAQEDLFRRFFGDDLGPFNQQFRNRRIPPRQGQGSGFVIDASGIALTNSHVVNNADQVILRFHDGSELKADSWHTDPWSDVAIVRFTPTAPLTPLKLGDSSAMDVGDWVLAFGDPFRVGISVTAGIISGTGRAPHINEREDFLQTDAAINPGNSGGPLVNIHGEVIGINTAISTRSGGYDGVGFAVPSNLAGWVANQLIQNGKVARPYLGVMVQPLDAELRSHLGVGFGEGAFVVQTTPDSPAATAGLQQGDVILDVAGKKVASGVSLQGIVEHLDIGQSYPVHVLRDGERVTINVVVQEMPQQFTESRSRTSEAGAAPAGPKTEASERLGLTVSDLTDELRRGLRLGQDAKGVVVTDVTDNGPAADAGISQGDLIERVGTSEVNNVEEFEAALQKAETGNSVLLFVRSGASARALVVHPKQD